MPRLSAGQLAVAQAIADPMALGLLPPVDAAFDATGAALGAFGPVTPRDPLSACGPVTPRDPVTAIGPVTPRDPVTAIGPVTPRDPVTACGPLSTSFGAAIHTRRAIAALDHRAIPVGATATLSLLCVYGCRHAHGRCQDDRHQCAQLLHRSLSSLSSIREPTHRARMRH
jgi:hypothetical protein